MEKRAATSQATIISEMLSGFCDLGMMSPVSSRVSIIYVGDSTLSVATVGSVSDTMVAGLAEDGSVEGAGTMGAPVGPIDLG